MNEIRIWIIALHNDEWCNIRNFGQDRVINKCFDKASNASFFDNQIDILNKKK